MNCLLRIVVSIASTKETFTDVNCMFFVCVFCLVVICCMFLFVYCMLVNMFVWVCLFCLSVDCGFVSFVVDSSFRRRFVVSSRRASYMFINVM